MTRTPREILSKLPSMTVLLKAAQEADGLREFPSSVVTGALRQAADAIRQTIQTAKADTLDVETAGIESIIEDARRIIASRRALRLTRVINATGIILHTGLGRSVLSEEAVENVTRTARGYCNLELELPSGKRGRRGSYIEEILCELTGAESALVVNNNAGATMLTLHALASKREVVVSRGHLIEIGGSFRLPEVMSAGGAILREVGTTNKTHLRDYASAIGDNTGLIMHVHTSNYRVVGFTNVPDVPELVTLAHDNDLPLFDDLGSGAILEDELWSEAGEPTASESLRKGADVVAFSGDKLLGGPQAGIILGKKLVVDSLRQSPMARALRIDKLTIAALEATLELYQDVDTARDRIPTLARLSETERSLMVRAEELASRLRTAMPNETFSVASDESFAGGGSLPAWPYPTAVVRWQPMSGRADKKKTSQSSEPSLDEITRYMRLSDPSVLPRISEGAIVFDLRTVIDTEYDELVSVAKAANGGQG